MPPRLTNCASSKITTVLLGILAVVLSIAFEKQNAYMVMLAFVIACSRQLPGAVHVGAVEELCDQGRVAGGFVSLILAVVCTIGSPAFGSCHAQPEGARRGSQYNSYSRHFLSMTAAFVTIWLVSILDNSQAVEEERALYPDQQIRSETGVGASGLGPLSGPLQSHSRDELAQCKSPARAFTLVRPAWRTFAKLPRSVPTNLLNSAEWQCFAGNWRHRASCEGRGKGIQGGRGNGRQREGRVGE